MAKMTMTWAMPRDRAGIMMHDWDDYLPEWEEEEDDMESGMLHEYHGELRGTWNRGCN